MSPTIVTVTPLSVSARKCFHPVTQMREDRAQIEERLGGMLVHAVAGVEDGQSG